MLHEFDTNTLSLLIDASLHAGDERLEALDRVLRKWWEEMGMWRHRDVTSA